MASRPKRPLRSIVLDPGIKDLLVDDAKDFLESKPWYAERGKFLYAYHAMSFNSNCAFNQAFLSVVAIFFMELPAQARLL